MEFLVGFTSKWSFVLENCSVLQIRQYYNQSVLKVGQRQKFNKHLYLTSIGSTSLAINLTSLYPGTGTGK